MPSASLNFALGFAAMAVTAGRADSSVGWPVPPARPFAGSPGAALLRPAAAWPPRSGRGSLADSVRRQAQRMTFRVRTISCASVSTGSAFAIDEHTLITNRHVLEGAATLELNAWEGSSSTADVQATKMAQRVDIGVS